MSAAQNGPVPKGSYPAGSAMNALKTTLDPYTYNTMFPQMDGGGLITLDKTFDVNGEFIVDDTNNGTTFNGCTENIPVTNSRGAIIWHPGLGPYAVARYGILEVGHVSQMNPLLLSAVQGVGYTASLVYSSGLPIPYNNMDPTQFTGYLGNAGSRQKIVHISPTADYESFSRLRAYAGALRLDCMSVPIGDIGLVGTFSAASVTDIRNVFQAPAAQGDITYTPPTQGANGNINQPPANVPPQAPFESVEPLSKVLIEQAAASSKNAIKEIDMSKDGVACVLGPDIPFRMTSIDPVQADDENGEWQTYPLLSTAGSAGLAIPGYGTATVYTGWYSPWNIGISDSSALYIGDPASAWDATYLDSSFILSSSNTICTRTASNPNTKTLFPVTQVSGSTVATYLIQFQVVTDDGGVFIGFADSTNRSGLSATGSNSLYPGSSQGSYTHSASMAAGFFNGNPVGVSRSGSIVANLSAMPAGPLSVGSSYIAILSIGSGGVTKIAWGTYVGSTVTWNNNNAGGSTFSTYDYTFTPSPVPSTWAACVSMYASSAALQVFGTPATITPAILTSVSSMSIGTWDGGAAPPPVVTTPVLAFNPTLTSGNITLSSTINTDDTASIPSYTGNFQTTITNRIQLNVSSNAKYYFAQLVLNTYTTASAMYVTFGVEDSNNLTNITQTGGNHYIGDSSGIGAAMGYKPGIGYYCSLSLNGTTSADIALNGLNNLTSSAPVAGTSFLILVGIQQAPESQTEIFFGINSVVTGAQTTGNYWNNGAILSIAGTPGPNPTTYDVVFASSTDAMGLGSSLYNVSASPVVIIHGDASTFSSANSIALVAPRINSQQSLPWNFADTGDFMQYVPGYTATADLTLSSTLVVNDTVSVATSNTRIGGISTAFANKVQDSRGRREIDYYWVAIYMSDVNNSGIAIGLTDVLNIASESTSGGVHYPGQHNSGVVNPNADVGFFTYQNGGANVTSFQNSTGTVWSTPSLGSGNFLVLVIGIGPGNLANVQFGTMTALGTILWNNNGVDSGTALDVTNPEYNQMGPASDSGWIIGTSMGYNATGGTSSAQIFGDQTTLQSAYPLVYSAMVASFGSFASQIQPWDTASPPPNVSLPLVNWQVINMGPIHPYGGVDIKVNVTPTTPTSGDISVAIADTWYFTFNHIYASLNGDGTIYYNVASEAPPSYYVGDIANYDTAYFLLETSTKGYQESLVNQSSVQLYGPNVSGQYIGTQFYIQVLNGENYTVQTGALTSGSISIRKRNTYQQEILPALILKYSNIAAQIGTTPGTHTNNQCPITLRLRGRIRSEVAPGTKVQPFVQEGSGRDGLERRCPYIGLYDFLDCMYSGDSPFYRVWHLREYADWIQNRLVSFSATDVAEFASANPYLRITAEQVNVLTKRTITDEEVDAERGVVAQSTIGIPDVVRQAQAGASFIPGSRSWQKHPMSQGTMMNASSGDIAHVSKRLRDLDTLMQPAIRKTRGKELRGLLEANNR